MKSIENKNISRHLKRVNKYYDKYSELYNNSINKLSGFSELSTIYTGINATWNEQKDYLQFKKNNALKQIKITYVHRNNEGKELTFEEAYEIADDIEFYELETAFNEALNETIELIDIEEHKENIVSEAEKINGLKEFEPFLRRLEETFNELNKVYLITSNLNALKRVLNIILINEFPDKINYYSNLSEAEKERFRPHNYKGELSKETIRDLTEYRKEYPKLPVNEFFETASVRYPSCNYLINEGNKIKVKFGTIRDRVKRDYPDIYYGNLDAL